MSDKRERELAKITSVRLGGSGTNGVLTLTLCFDYDGGTGQCMSGIILDTWDEMRKRRVGSAGGLDMVIQILSAVGVEDLDQLKGKEVWVEHDWSHVYSIEGPGYVKNRGPKFDIEAWRNEWFPKATGPIHERKRVADPDSMVEAGPQ